ncbi:MAG: hypothetical protein IJD65_05840 [Mailhella sp.]|nr:hypothetical protein [Mailhella sp.]
MSSLIDSTLHASLIPDVSTSPVSPSHTPARNPVQKTLEERPTPIEKDLDTARPCAMTPLSEESLEASNASTKAVMEARITEKSAEAEGKGPAAKPEAGETAAADSLSASPTGEKKEADNASDRPVVQPGEKRIAEDGSAVHEVEVDERIFALISDYRSEAVDTSGLPLGGLRLKLEQVREDLNLIASQKPLLTEKDDASAITVIEVRLTETALQLETAITSRTHMEERLDAVQNTLSSSATPEEKLAKLSEFGLIWKTGHEQTQALARMKQEGPAAQREVLEAFEAGIGMVNEDFRTFSGRLFAAMGTLAAEAFQNRGLTPPAPDSLKQLVSFCFLSGNSPHALLQALVGGTSWASSTAHQDDLLKLFFEQLVPAPKAGDSIALVSQRMAFVDMVFQGASREFSDTALTLKKMFCPGKEMLAELQHQSRMVGLRLHEAVLDAMPSSLRQKGAIANLAASSLSARSYLITPELVQGFKRATGLRTEGFNYHMAHAAVLQMRALRAGAFPDAGESHPVLNVGAWCEKLGLDQATARYAAELDDELDGAENEQGMRMLLGAAEIFLRGLEGEAAVARAGKEVIDQANASTPLFKADKKENAFYEASGSYLAREALDRTIVDLTGMLDDSRFEGEGFKLNGKAVSDNMRERTARLLANMHARISEEAGRGLADLHDRISEEAGRELPDMARAMENERRAFLKDMHELQKHSRSMMELARSSRELVELRTRISEESSLLDSMKAAKRLVHLSWPHKHAERLRISELVMQTAALRQSLLSAAGQAEREQLQNQIAANLESMKDVDPFSLTRSRNRNSIPDMDMLLEAMLPRARAIHFFKAANASDGGIAMSEADKAMRSIKRSRSAIMETQKTIDKALKSIVGMFGETSATTMRKTVTAAVLKAFVDSQEDISRFDARSSKAQAAVMDQLAAWGLTAPTALMKSLVRSTVESLINDDGTLREDRLRELTEESFSLSGKASLERFKQDLRTEQGYSRFKAWRAARNKKSLGLIEDARRRKEGVGMLMEEASMPGSGFIYERGRGINIDTGKKFSPISAKNSMINVTNLASPLAIRVKAMSTDSLMVSNIGEKGYQVLIKGGLKGSLGATFKLALPHVILPFEGNVQSSEDSGIALTFSSKEDCERFVTAFMDSKSGLHAADMDRASTAQEGYDPDIWLKASQIRFVHNGSVSADVSLAAMFTLFSASLAQAPASISGSVTFKSELAGGVKQSVEENALGQNVTFSRSIRFSQIATAGAGVTLGTNYISTPKLNAARSFTLSAEESFKLVTGDKGIMPDTSLDYEFATGGLDGHLICNLFMPDEVARKIEQNESFATAFNALVAGLPPTARLSLHCVLKPSVLAEVRGLLAKARGMAGEEERKAAQQKVSDLLSDSSSYKPESISVRNASPKDIAKNWSPGLYSFQVVRDKSFLRLSRSEPLKIALPD